MPLILKKNSIATQVLFLLDAAEEVGEIVFSTPHQWRSWSLHGKHYSYKTILHRLMDAGLVQVIEDGERERLRLTKKGEMEVLMAKAMLPHSGKWDGKWRVVIFDIPEDHSSERDELRRLLLKNKFKKLQASVYISPWPLNRDAVRYLKETGLIDYVRFGRLDELDEDRDLRKHYKI